MSDNTFESDLDFLRAALPELQSYMLSKEVFWPVCCPTVGGRDMSKLTFGNLYLVMERLQAVTSPDLKSEAGHLIDQVNAFLGKWHANVFEKLIREYGARLRLWQGYLTDTLNADDRSLTEYAYKVRWRAILGLIEKKAGAELDDSEVDLVRQLDKTLKAITRQGNFVWEEIYRPVFPEQSYWYLYRSLNGAD